MLCFPPASSSEQDLFSCTDCQGGPRHCPRGSLPLPSLLLLLYLCIATRPPSLSLAWDRHTALCGGAVAWHGLPVARERGLRPVVSHTYIRTCDSTYTHIHDERHRYPGALNSHLIASNDNEEREYPSHIPAQLPHPPLLQPPVRPRRQAAGSCELT